MASFSKYAFAIMTHDVVDGELEYVVERVTGDVVQIYPGILCGIVKRGSKMYGTYELSTGLRVGQHCKTLAYAYDQLDTFRRKPADAWFGAVSNRFIEIGGSHGMAVH